MYGQNARAKMIKNIFCRPEKMDHHRTKMFLEFKVYVCDCVASILVYWCYAGFQGFQNQYDQTWVNVITNNFIKFKFLIFS